jgi:hypothetical protein
MIIKKKRVRNIATNAPFIKNGQKYQVGISLSSVSTSKLKQLGLEKATVGDSVLPSAEFGPVSRYNAEGKSVPNKKLPKETMYRQAEWCWKQWAGRGETIEVCKIVDVPYKRYPRTHFAPPSIELAVLTDSQGERVIVTPAIKYEVGNENDLTHGVNLILEIFGECRFFDDSLSQIIKVPLKRLNWSLLPPGERPWATLKNELQPIIKQVSKGKRRVIENRLETINKHKPNFAAVGTGGFSGYVVLGFPKINLYVLESLLYGNATYILGSDWKNLSQLTKKEILANELHEERIIHQESWYEKINLVIKTKLKK